MVVVAAKKEVIPYHKGPNGSKDVHEDLVLLRQ